MIDAVSLKKMFLSGAQALDAKKEWINELNVCPVPDGDTGTNMTMTIMSAAREVLEQPDDSMEKIARAMSSGALRGARGNSGVILSQLFRGFAKVVREKDKLEIPDLVEAMKKAVDSAYKAVMKPKEGTILTVARAVMEKAEELSDTDDMAFFLRNCIEHGDEALAHTPELLPVLKQAGVVDSGGQGLMVVLHGIYDAFMGKEIDLSIPEAGRPREEQFRVDTEHLDTSDIKFGYCTEFIIKLDREFPESEEDLFKDFLNSIGDSIVCVADEEVVKIHVHTNDPGKALQKALSYGQLSRIKIDNMREEHEERLFRNAEKLAEEQKAADEKRKAEALPFKPVGFVAVCAGDGLRDIFKELGVDYVIEGGQTMNPSTDDILSAINKVRAETVFVLPNNKNIILAAEQAAGMVKDRRAIVIHSKTICQGLTCMINYIPDVSIEENEEMMNLQMKTVKTLEVTYAIRDTVIEGVEIHKDDFMVLGDKGILSCGTDLTESVREAVQNCLDDESALVSIYYGQDVSEEEAETLKNALLEIAGDAEVEANYGGQPVYYYIISVE